MNQPDPADTRFETAVQAHRDAGHQGEFALCQDSGCQDAYTRCLAALVGDPVFRTGHGVPQQRTHGMYHC